MTTIQQQSDLFETFRGQTGTHYELARKLEQAGFLVEMDSDDNARSEIKLQGCSLPDGSDVVIGEIVGDSEATIR